jgi:hypothetical protein
MVVLVFLDIVCGANVLKVVSPMILNLKKAAY